MANQWIKKSEEPKEPTTFEEAVKLVAASLTEEVASDPRFHFSGGMQIRNSLGLWNKEGILYKHMQERFGLGHADDTGMLITNAARALNKGEEYNPWIDVERCKKHWEQYGVNPATGLLYGE